MMSGVTFGKFIAERLSQIKVNTVFGTPNIHNLELLSAINNISSLRFIDDACVLYCVYAVDSYSSLKGL